MVLTRAQAANDDGKTQQVPSQAEDADSHVSPDRDDNELDDDGGDPTTDVQAALLAINSLTKAMRGIERRMEASEENTHRLVEETVSKAVEKAVRDVKTGPANDTPDTQPAATAAAGQ